MFKSSVIRRKLVRRSSLLQSMLAGERKEMTADELQLARSILEWWTTEARRLNVELVGQRGAARRRGERGRHLWTTKAGKNYIDVGDVAGLVDVFLKDVSPHPAPRPRNPRRLERDSMVIYLARILDLSSRQIADEWQDLIDASDAASVLKRRPEMTLAFCEWMLLSPSAQAKAGLDDPKISAVLRIHDPSLIFRDARRDAPMKERRQLT